MNDENERSVASTGSVDALAGDRETTGSLTHDDIMAEADGSLTHDDIMAEADQFIRDDRSGWTLVYKMRAEIARLRLTDTDKNAIRLGELAFPGLRMTDKGRFVDVWATLRGLVERQNRIVCDTKMDTTLGDGTVQNECSVATWTDLTIQSPPLNEEVLVLTDDGCHVCAYRQGDGLSGCYFEREDMKVFHDVTNWMPLPDPQTDAK